MSNHLVSDVYKRELGSLTRKAIMALLADKASDNGTGIWASKQTMAAELCTSKQTVITTIKALTADGLLVEVGHRKCQNGYLVEYAIVVAALKRLALVKPHQDNRSKPLTGQAALPVKLDDLTSQAALPDRSSSLTQTPLEPPLNHTPPPPRRGGHVERAPIPSNWITPKIEQLPEAIRTLAGQWPTGAYQAEAEAFFQHWTGRGHRRADWVALWASRVQDRHADVMRAAKAGVTFIGSAGAPEASATPSLPKAPSAAKKDEDARSDELHGALRLVLGTALWEQWFDPAALIITDDELAIVSPTPFARHWIENHQMPAVQQAIDQLGWHVDLIYHRVSPPKLGKSEMKAGH